MLAHSYRLACNAKTAPSDYIPSLVGIDPQQVSPAGSDTYFTRQDEIEFTVTSISFSRWVTYDSLPLPYRDPIMGLKTSRGAFYLPYSELRECAVASNDQDVLELLAAFPTPPRELV